MSKALRNRFLSTALILLLVAACNTPGRNGPEPDPDAPVPPVAVITMSPPSGSGTAPLTVTLGAGSSSGDVTSYQWQVDGVVISTGSATTHTFEAAGTYTVRLTVTAVNGLQATAEAVYVVQPALQPGQSHALNPENYGAFPVSISPAGAWTATSPAGWLTVSPTSGSGGDTSLSLTVNPGAFTTSANTYQTTLVITDTAGVRTDAVTVRLPQLSVPGAIQRTGLAAGSSTSVPVTLTNSGTSTLTVALGLQGAGGVQVVLNSAGGSISPTGNQSFDLLVTCPANAASYSGTLTATTNDPRVPSSSVSLTFACEDAAPTGGFNITLVFQPGAFTPEQQAMVRAAADRWEEVIVGDIPDAREASPSQRDFCLNNISWGTGIASELAAVGDFDDLLVAVWPYQTSGTVLAQAGPCWFSDRPMPNYGRVMINTNQLDYMVSTNSLETVIIHELGHVLGIGTLWRREGSQLISPSLGHCGNPSLDPGVPRTYGGERGVAEYRALGAAGEPQVDDYCGHWHEARFGDEVLTPVIRINQNGNNHQPLSRMTLGALEDLGYVVDHTAADAYSLPLPGLRVEEGETFILAEPLLLIPDL